MLQPYNQDSNRPQDEVGGQPTDLEQLFAPLFEAAAGDDELRHLAEEAYKIATSTARLVALLKEIAKR